MTIDRNEQPSAGALPRFVDSGLFRRVMRELPGSVTIVAAGEGADRRGLTATAICSLSVEPPSLIACVNRRTEGHAAITRYGAFCVNVISAEHEALADRFAGRDGARGVERFAHGVWTTLVTGAPVLEGALAAFDCEVIEAVDYSSHTVFIGGVRAALAAPRRSALVYRAGAYHALCGSVRGTT
jgi:flavin reductase (DIM6/NTAB) family NADH-FMN oxidoreductase RutF